MDKEFIEIIAGNESLLYKVCKLYSKTEDDRKDMFQDIVLNLWRSFPSFQAKSKVTTWMYRIALNTAISHLRKQKNKQPIEQLGELAYQIPASPTESADEWETLYGAIEQLSPIDKAIVMLYLEDHSYQEMGEIIGISASNIGFKLSKIKEKLRKTVNV
ncbi:MAG: RNA polymerase sigma factor [Bacteroidota bacterium]